MEGPGRGPWNKTEEKTDNGGRSRRGGGRMLAWVARNDFGGVIGTICERIPGRTIRNDPGTAVTPAPAVTSGYKTQTYLHDADGRLST